MKLQGLCKFYRASAQQKGESRVIGGDFTKGAAMEPQGGYMKKRSLSALSWTFGIVLERGGGQQGRPNARGRTILDDRWSRIGGCNSTGIPTVPRNRGQQVDQRSLRDDRRPAHQDRNDRYPGVNRVRAGCVARALPGPEGIGCRCRHTGGGDKKRCRTRF